MTFTKPFNGRLRTSMVILCTLFTLAACTTGRLNSTQKSPACGPLPTETSIMLVCGEGAQFEIIGSQGQRVLIDVSDPLLLSRPANDKDLLLTTHFHFDHFNQRFMDTFPGKQLQDRQGEILRPGLTIKGIASHHSEHIWDEKNPAWSNYIFVVETGGIRVAHFGDIGQKQLTPTQLTTLGRVDVAITQFVNPYSQMNLENQKGFHLMDQVRPKLIIPHHGASSEEAIRLAMSRWRVVCAKSNRLTLSRKILPERTTVILMGEMANYMQKTLDLDMWQHTRPPQNG